MGPGQLRYFEKCLSPVRILEKAIFGEMAQKWLYVPMVFDQPTRKLVFWFFPKICPSPGMCLRKIKIFPNFPKWRERSRTTPIFQKMPKARGETRESSRKNYFLQICSKVPIRPYGFWSTNEEARFFQDCLADSLVRPLPLNPPLLGETFPAIDPYLLRPGREF